ncbi:uncharacterized protein LACBIDRAFT_325891 [Laccaria bicolor S238N-H82]|uniref:Predicted protein n=1 Tax=Laccaria bicolor (strain S238N-H82 / ATCC MYA-4686) TaxID=486041 RepID=B0D6L0_LACBS|nr:uncharacterized protein LACBIDRAFT_325891 [Laccaria bicolor S238N-H82]EDR10204.1 predicted protein [Laccaria bicolor S238N-H82]|eukprot:XP_001879589.1 predicted protein [Laccaria bicolor S238N-H82]
MTTAIGSISTYLSDIYITYGKPQNTKIIGGATTPVKKATAPPGANRKGETGTGKTSFLSLLVNILAGRSPDDYDLEPYDVTNECGGAQKHSQTNTAKVYRFASLNGVDVTVLDTPGLADTRGLQKDKEHKQSITTAIRDNIPEVTAVIILANGTNPRLGVATDYAITTLSSIFPRTLAQNIGILFTNVSSPLSWNFEVDTLPVELRGAKRFLVDNPLAMQKNYLKIRAKAEAEGEIDENDQDILDELEAAVNTGHQATLKMLVKIFNWLDGLEPQATKEIMSLYNQSIEIERNISSTLARMTQLSEKRANLDRLIKQSDGIKLTVNGTANFKSVINKKTWVFEDKPRHSTLCGHPQCYSNCHINCSVGFTLDPAKLGGCEAFSRSTCRKCHHSITEHHHYNSVWYEKSETHDYIDADAKRRHDEANKMLQTATVSIADVRKVIESTGKEMAEATEQIGRLAAKYSELSLSGSFSGQVKKSVKLLETHLEGIRNTSDQMSIDQMEASLAQLKEKLRVLEVAADAARKKISQPTIVDRLNQGFTRLFGLS